MERTAGAAQPSEQTVTLAQEGNASAVAASTAVAVAPASTAAAEKSPTTESKAISPLQSLWTAAQTHAHNEVWGVKLADPATHVPSQIILQKYLNANDGDVMRAKEQLNNTLDFRAKTHPIELVQKHFSNDKFAGLGYITSYADTTSTPGTKEVFTWNLYGGVKDVQKSFGDLDAFIDWRVALMEMAIQELDLGSATQRITAEEDHYKIYQVHDYKGINFFRSPPAVRSAAKKTVEVLAMAYPETLREKFFVNVPAIMGFMYGVMKLFVAPKTIKKFHPMSNGGALHLEFAEAKVKGLGQMLPKEYGGKGGELGAVGKEPLLE